MNRRIFMKLKQMISGMIQYTITIIVVIFICVYMVSLQQVVGSSMNSTLKDGDITLLNKFGYHFFEIKRNDIVSIDYNDTKYLVKRIIGLPGEKIEYKDNILYVNDIGYYEKFLNEGTTTKDFSIKDLGYDVIPEHMYLVLGDNREDSLDSREIGLIKEEDIEGKVFLRIWPLNKITFIP